MISNRQTKMGQLVWVFFFHIFFQAFILRFPLVGFIASLPAVNLISVTSAKHDGLVVWSHEMLQIAALTEVDCGHFIFISVNICIIFLFFGGGPFPVCDSSGIHSFPILCHSSLRRQLKLVLSGTSKQSKEWFSGSFWCAQMICKQIYWSCICCEHNHVDNERVSHSKSKNTCTVTVCLDLTELCQNNMSPLSCSIFSSCLFLVLQIQLQ